MSRRRLTEREYEDIYSFHEMTTTKRSVLQIPYNGSMLLPKDFRCETNDVIETKKGTRIGVVSQVIDGRGILTLDKQYKDRSVKLPKMYEFLEIENRDKHEKYNQVFKDMVNDFQCRAIMLDTEAKEKLRMQEQLIMDLAKKLLGSNWECEILC